MVVLDNYYGYYEFKNLDEKEKEKMKDIIFEEYPNEPVDDKNLIEMYNKAMWKRNNYENYKTKHNVEAEKEYRESIKEKMKKKEEPAPEPKKVMPFIMTRQEAIDELKKTHKVKTPNENQINHYRKYGKLPSPSSLPTKKITISLPEPPKPETVGNGKEKICGGCNGACGGKVIKEDKKKFDEIFLEGGCGECHTMNEEEGGSKASGYIKLLMAKKAGMTPDDYENAREKKTYGDEKNFKLLDNLNDIKPSENATQYASPYLIKRFGQTRSKKFLKFYKQKFGKEPSLWDLFKLFKTKITNMKDFFEKIDNYMVLTEQKIAMLEEKKKKKQEPKPTKEKKVKAPKPVFKDLSDEDKLKELNRKLEKTKSDAVKEKLTKQIRKLKSSMRDKVPKTGTYKFKTGGAKKYIEYNPSSVMNTDVYARINKNVADFFSPIEKMKYMKENPKTILLPKEKKARKQKLMELKLAGIDPKTVSDEAKGEVAQAINEENIPTLSGSFEKTIDPLLQNYGNGKSKINWKKKFQDHMKEMKKLQKNSVTMDKKDYLAEHKRLIGLLDKMIAMASKESNTQKSEPALKGGRRLPPIPDLTLEQFKGMYGNPMERNQFEEGPIGDEKYKTYMENFMKNYERRKLGWSPTNWSQADLTKRHNAIEAEVRRQEEYARSPEFYYKELVEGRENEPTTCPFDNNGQVPLDQWTGKPTSFNTTAEQCMLNTFYNPTTGKLDAETAVKRRRDLMNASNREVSGWELFKRGFTGSIKTFAQPFLDVVSIVPGIGSVASMLSKGIDLLPSAENAYGGAKKKGLELHAVIIKKPMDKEEAMKHAQSIIKAKKFMRETGTSYRFRNIPKTKFEPKSFKTKKINPQISMVFGKLK